MKHLAFSSFLFLLAMNCCSNEEIINNNTNANYEKRISVVVEDLTPANSTRTTYTESGNGYHFAWAAGDALGIFPENGYQTAFPINEGKGIGTNTAVFDGGDWALKANKSYAAYYPFIESLSFSKTEIPVDYTGQVQNGNGSTTHLSAYDYMASTFTEVDAKGNVNFQLQHLGCLVQFKLTMPEVDTYSALEITSDNTPFITAGEYSLSEDGHSLKNPQTSQTTTIGLNNVSTTAENKVLTITAMFSPVDLSESKLTLIVKGNQKDYEIELNGQDLSQGNFVKITSAEAMSVVAPYVTFHAEEEQTLTMSKAVETLEYSVNNGIWTTLGTNTVPFGGTTGDLRLRGKSSIGTAVSDTDYSQITFGDNAKKVSCTGDIRTLVDYENHETANTSNARFCALFWDCQALISAPELPAMVLADNCYRNMFVGTKITQAPQLPAEELKDFCYSSMFVSTSITEAPELPATTLADYCYFCMFQNCRYLTKAPELPATTLAESCYTSLFLKCTSLVNAPELNATELKEYCYYNMFNGCTSLIKAPELPATSLVASCYSTMFKGCTKLNYVKMNAIDVSANSCLGYWLDGVASAGTFVKNKNATWNITGPSGIPTGWTVINGDEQGNVIDGILNGHGYVDLGITDSEGHTIYWATCNVGASTPEDYGGYYAWGETKADTEEDTSNMHNYAYTGSSSYIKRCYNWETYKWATGTTESTISKYYSGDSKTKLDPADDAATANWGEGWRMPTTAEFTALVNNCYWCPTNTGLGFIVYKAKCDNDKGYVGKNPTETYTEADKHIILPQPGYRSYNMAPDTSNREGFYWCSDLNSSDWKTNSLYFNNYMGIHVRMESASWRCIGYSIRPVFVSADNQ